MSLSFLFAVWFRVSGNDFHGGDAAVLQLHPAVGQGRHYRIVRDHHQRVSLLVQFPQQPQYELFVGGVAVMMSS